MTTIDEINGKVDALGSAWEQFKQKNDERLNELAKKGNADPLLTGQLEKISSDMDGTKAAMDKQATEIESLKTALSRADRTGGEGEKESAEAKAYKAAFLQYVRKGDQAVLDTKALSVGSDPDGGYTVTPFMSNTIVKAVQEFSPIRGLAAVQTISTDALEFLDDPNTLTSGWTGETTAITETNTPQIGKRNIPTHEMYAQPKATQKLLDDSFVNIEQWLSDKIAESFAIREATAFVSGNGVGQPRGFLTYTAGTSWGQIQQVVTGSAAAVAADGMLSLLYSLKEAYAAGASFVANRATVASIRKLKESTTNAYIWQPGLQAGQPDLLLGKPIIQATDMPVEAANALVVAYANWKQAYQIVDRVGIRILRDPYTEKPFIKFYATKRVGGDVANYEAIKLLKCST